TSLTTANTVVDSYPPGGRHRRVAVAARGPPARGDAGRGAAALRGRRAPARPGGRPQALRLLDPPRHRPRRLGGLLGPPARAVRDLPPGSALPLPGRRTALRAGRRPGVRPPARPREPAPALAAAPAGCRLPPGARIGDLGGRRRAGRGAARLAEHGGLPL